MLQQWAQTIIKYVWSLKQVRRGSWCVTLLNLTACSGVTPREQVTVKQWDMTSNVWAFVHLEMTPKLTALEWKAPSLAHMPTQVLSLFFFFSSSGPDTDQLWQLEMTHLVRAEDGLLPSLCRGSWNRKVFTPRWHLTEKDHYLNVPWGGGREVPLQFVPAEWTLMAA